MTDTGGSEALRQALDFIEGEGYRRCDIPACNCGSWHGGHYSRRLAEIREVVEPANGETLLAAVTRIVVASRPLTDTSDRLREIHDELNAIVQLTHDHNTVGHRINESVFKAATRALMSLAEITTASANADHGGGVKSPEGSAVEDSPADTPDSEPSADVPAAHARIPSSEPCPICGAEKGEPCRGLRGRMFGLPIEGVHVVAPTERETRDNE